MIKNLSKNRILAKDHEECKTTFSKAKGLMFTFPLKNKGLVFIFEKEKRISLHMFFVFYPIDLIFLNKNKRIVEMKENFLPFNLYMSKRKAKYVLEFPIRTIKMTKSEIGDKIQWKN